MLEMYELLLFRNVPALSATLFSQLVVAVQLRRAGRQRGLRQSPPTGDGCQIEQGVVFQSPSSEGRKNHQIINSYYIYLYSRFVVLAAHS